MVLELHLTFGLYPIRFEILEAKNIKWLCSLILYTVVVFISSVTPEQLFLKESIILENKLVSQTEESMVR